jgi:23S rRNA (pseudouridine1915-N3)-methyltransferase
MKFSDIGQEKWLEWKSYVDTCVLPLTGLNGSEEPWEATAALERLRDALDPLERRFTGRLVIYPALHYMDGQGEREHLSRVCRNLKEGAGFAFVILVAGFISGDAQMKPEEADLWIDAGQAARGTADALVTELWRSGSKRDLDA